MSDGQTRRRLDALEDYAILDTDPEQDFDDIAFIAAHACAAPIALVSLVESERQWFKARVGIAAPQTPIDQSVCALGLASTDLLIIPDLTVDGRTCLNTLVTEGPEIRFYAGAPLVTPGGTAIGMLCVIDTLPRPEGLTADQQRMLRGLARQVIALLELRKVALASRAVAERQLSAEEAGRIGTFEVDVGGDEMIVSAQFCRIFGVAVRPAYPVAEIEALVLAMDADLPSSPLSRADGSAAPAVDYRIRRADDGAIRWVSRRAEFTRDADGRVTHMIGLVQDVTDQQLLNGEISHRLKNTLSLVQSIAVQTLRDVADRGPVQEFEKRLIALGAAHDVLLRRTLPTAPVRAVIDAVVEALGAKERTATDGPPVELGSQAAMMLAMLVHELTTNSMKYGALSNPVGRNDVRWSIDAADATFTLEWVERGGPPVARPTRTGFGSRLIARGLGSAGAMETRFDPAGFAATLRVPLSAID